GYQFVALVACLRFRLRREPDLPPLGLPVSVLKPAHGVDPGFLHAVISHLEQKHATFELLIGVRDPSGLLVVPPQVRVTTVVTETPNGKVGSLIDLVRAARHDIIIVNDADIRVPPGYIARVTAPLADPAVSLVTCLYRAHGASFAARLEALGVATDFAPSAL